MTNPKDGHGVLSFLAWNRSLGIEEVMDKFGACLGVRNAIKEYVQLFYICPIRCVSDYIGTVREDVKEAILDDDPVLKLSI